MGEFGVLCLFIYIYILRTYCYFEDNLKEALSPFIPPFSSKPSVILALASEPSLMQFSKLFAWAKPTKLSPFQKRKMKVVVVMMGNGQQSGQRIPFKVRSFEIFLFIVI